MVSTVAMLTMLVVGITMNLATIVALVVSGAILAVAAFAMGSMVIGYLLAGSRPAARSVMVLGTSFRGVTAALIVASANFAGTETVPFILVAAILLLVIALPSAMAMGRRETAVSPLPVVV